MILVWRIEFHILEKPVIFQEEVSWKITGFHSMMLGQKMPYGWC